MTPKNGKSNIKQQITDNLRRVYDEAYQEDVPDAFAKLVERFREEKEKIDRANPDDK
jgi:hypothetical protein